MCVCRVLLYIAEFCLAAAAWIHGGVQTGAEPNVCNNLCTKSFYNTRHMVSVSERCGEDKICPMES